MDDVRELEDLLEAAGRDLRDRSTAYVAQRPPELPSDTGGLMRRATAVAAVALVTVVAAMAVVVAAGWWQPRGLTIDRDPAGRAAIVWNSSASWQAEATSPGEPLAPGWEQLHGWEGRFHAYTARSEAGVLVWGGGQDPMTDRLEGLTETWDGSVVDPETGAFHTTAATPLCRQGQARAVWADGELVVWNQPGAELADDCPDAAAYRPADDRWRTIDSPFFAQLDNEPVVWADGQLMAWTQGVALDLDTGQTRPFPAAPQGQATQRRMQTPVIGHWTGERLFVLGSGDLLAYDPDSQSWGQHPAPPIDGRALTSAWTDHGLLAVNYTMQAALFDPGMAAWTELPDLPLRFSECTPHVASSPQLAVVRMCSGLALGDGTGTWRLAPLPPPQAFGELLITDDHLLMVGEHLWRYPLSAAADDQSDQTPPGTVPIGALHQFSPPPGWTIEDIHADAPAPAAQTVTIELRGPADQTCKIQARYALRLPPPEGTPATLVRTRDGQTIDVHQVEATGSTPAQVQITELEPTDAIIITCPTLESARELTANLWRPDPEQADPQP